MRAVRHVVDVHRRGRRDAGHEPVAARHEHGSGSDLLRRDRLDGEVRTGAVQRRGDDRTGGVGHVDDVDPRPRRGHEGAVPGPRHVGRRPRQRHVTDECEAAVVPTLGPTGELVGEGHVALQPGLRQVTGSAQRSGRRGRSSGAPTRPTTKTSASTIRRNTAGRYPPRPMVKPKPRSGVEIDELEPVERRGAADGVEADHPPGEPAGDLGREVPPVEIGEHLERAVRPARSRGARGRGRARSPAPGRRASRCRRTTPAPGAGARATTLDSGPMRAYDDLAVRDRHLVVVVLVHPHREPAPRRRCRLRRSVRDAAAEVLLAPADEDRPRVVETVVSRRGASAIPVASGSDAASPSGPRTETHCGAERSAVEVVARRCGRRRWPHPAARSGMSSVERRRHRPAVDPVDRDEERLAAEHVVAAA